MLPGLVLTVGLIAQSIGTPGVAALISPVARNPHAPRFVNIGDSIIESKTAKPVAPAAACVPAPAPTQIVQREIIYVPVPAAEAPDEPPPSVDPRLDDSTGGLLFFPTAVSPFRSGMHPHPHSSPRAPSPLMRPQTVMLPPFPTVLLPPGSAPRGR
jgi:hypothetical protein